MKHRKRHVKNKVYGLKAKKPIFKKPMFWIVSLFVIIIFSFLYLFVFYSKVQVGLVVISGNNNVQTKDIETIAWNDINKKVFKIGYFELLSKSILLTGPEKISKDILNKFPEIALASVSKKFLQTINIQIQEREPFAVFCTKNNEKCFYIDKTGVIFKLLEQQPENMTVINYSLEDSHVLLGKRAIEENTINAISKIKKILIENFQIDVKTANISKPFKLDIETSENWKMYFDLESNTDLQIAKMQVLLKDEVGSEVRKTLQYIDLRFKDRAYYK